MIRWSSYVQRNQNSVKTKDSMVGWLGRLAGYFLFVLTALWLLWLGIKRKMV